MSDFAHQYAWQEQYINDVVKLIAPYLITVGRPEVDKNQAGDLELAFPRNGTVSVRLRKPDKAKFVGDVTMRSRSANGGRTEISKIIDGFGDYFFYGHVSDDGRIWFWHLLDLSAVRAAFQRNGNKLLRRSEVLNQDGTRFLVFKPEYDFPQAIMAHEAPGVAA